MNIFSESEQSAALRYIKEHGYVLFGGVLADDDCFSRLQSDYDLLLARERKHPYDPGDGPSAPEDVDFEAYVTASFNVSAAEVARVMRRNRHTRAQNNDTRWPVPPEQVNDTFRHLPLLLDDDRTQRSFNLPSKLAGSDRLIEHPILMPLLSSLIDEDMVLSDFSAFSVGPHTDGGYWHVDAPFTTVPEPLPEMPLAIQVAWMIDDFTAENGATRVVPCTHLSGRKPPWDYESQDGEIALTAPAGSLAVWYSQTWHRAGANGTDRPRRAILANYVRAWIKPQVDFTQSLTSAQTAQFSHRARYMLVPCLRSRIVKLRCRVARPARRTSEAYRWYMPSECNAAGWDESAAQYKHTFETRY